MKSKFQILGAAVALSFLAYAQANAAVITYVGGADPVSVSYYANGNFTDTGSSISFSGSPASANSISSISELRDYYNGTDSDPSWPSASIVFAADFNATINVPTSGSYTFQFGTDDAGYLFIGGNLIADQGGIHAVDIQPYTVSLAAGTYSLEVQYDNIYCCGAIAYVGLNGVQAPVPEISTWAMLLCGFAGLGFAGYLRTKHRHSIVADA